MSEHIFRNPEFYKIEPLREWIRRMMPNASDGFVVIDLDYNRGMDDLGKNVWIRRYGQRYDLDEQGDAMIISIKENRGRQTGAEGWIYRFLDTGMKTGDMRKRWRGIHYLKIDYTEDFPICSMCKQSWLTEDKAFELFLTAKLKWDGEDISHEELKHVLGDV